MPDLLRRSRDFVAESVAKVRSARPGYGPGPEIPFEPFDAHNVSTPAGLLKLGTSIASERRARANYQRTEADKELPRQIQREQIAKLRAETSYYERRPGGGGGARTSATQMPVGPNTVGVDPNTPRYLLGPTLTERNRQRTAEKTGKLAAYKAQIQQIDTDAKNRIEERMLYIGGDVERNLIQAVNSKDPRIRNWALQHLEIPPESYQKLSQTPDYQQKMIGVAREQLLKRIRGRVTAEETSRRRGTRQQIVDAMQGLGLELQVQPDEASYAEPETPSEEPMNEDNDYLDFDPATGELIPPRQ